MPEIEPPKKSFWQYWRDGYREYRSYPSKPLFTRSTGPWGWIVAIVLIGAAAYFGYLRAR